MGKGAGPKGSNGSKGSKGKEPIDLTGDAVASAAAPVASAHQTSVDLTTDSQSDGAPALDRPAITKRLHELLKSVSLEKTSMKQLGKRLGEISEGGFNRNIAEHKEFLKDEVRT